jgi:hypothetical protein
MNTRKLLIGAAAMAVAATAWAWPGEPPPPPPPPPPELNDCSPGFWKNHQEYWATQFCSDSSCVFFVMGELTSQGPGSGDRRQRMAGALNSWADGYYRAQICTD